MSVLCSILLTRLVSLSAVARMTEWGEPLLRHDRRSLHSLPPNFPVETRGVEDLHTALSTESRTRGTSLAARSRKSGYAPVEMTKGRAALPGKVVAE